MKKKYEYKTRKVSMVIKEEDFVKLEEYAKEKGLRVSLLLKQTMLKKINGVSDED